MQTYKCTNCTSLTDSPQTRGSGLIEIALYLFAAIIGGVIYSIWRRMGGPSVCPTCKKDCLVPFQEDVSTVKCEWCAESIQATAKICRYCKKPVERKFVDEPKANKQIIVIAKLFKNGHTSKEIAAYLVSKKQTYLEDGSDWSAEKVESVISQHIERVSINKTRNIAQEKRTPIKLVLLTVVLALLILGTVAQYITKPKVSLNAVPSVKGQTGQPVDSNSTDVKKANGSRNYSDTCKTVAAKKWLLDFTMEFGKPTFSQKTKMIQRVSSLSKQVRDSCGQNGVNLEILQSAKRKIKPEWLKTEIDALID